MSIFFKGSSSSSSSSSDEEAPAPSRRRVTKNVTYNMKEYDDMIKSALAADEEYEEEEPEPETGRNPIPWTLSMGVQKNLPGGGRFSGLNGGNLMHFSVLLH